MCVVWGEGVSTDAEAREEHQVPSSVTLSLIPLTDELSLNLDKD